MAENGKTNVKIIYDKILDGHLLLSCLHANLKSFLENENIEDLQAIESDIDKLDIAVNNIKEALTCYIQGLTIDGEFILGEQTDNGVKL